MVGFATRLLVLLLLHDFPPPFTPLPPLFLTPIGSNLEMRAAAVSAVPPPPLSFHYMVGLFKFSVVAVLQEKERWRYSFIALFGWISESRHGSKLRNT